MEFFINRSAAAFLEPGSRMHVVVNACCIFGVIFLGVVIYLFNDIQEEVRLESIKGNLIFSCC